MNNADVLHDPYRGDKQRHAPQYRVRRYERTAQDIRRDQGCVSANKNQKIVALDALKIRLRISRENILFYPTDKIHELLVKQFFAIHPLQITQDFEIFELVRQGRLRGLIDF